VTLKIKNPPAFYAVVLVKSTNVSEVPADLVIELKRNVLCTYDICYPSVIFRNITIRHHVKGKAIA